MTMVFNLESALGVNEEVSKTSGQMYRSRSLLFWKSRSRSAMRGHRWTGLRDRV